MEIVMVDNLGGPLFSVLINNYNYAEFLPQCLDSALAQTFDDFEIVIVDDGSTDQSREIISDYQAHDERIKVIFKENGGQASAFNAGLLKCKGEIVCFLDSDDWWMDHKLDTIRRWDSLLNCRYAMIQHNLDVWDEGKVSPFKTALYSGNLFAHTATTGELGLFVGTSGLCFRRDVLEKVMPVPERMRIGADAYLTRTTFTMENVYSIPDSLGYYRKHRNAVLGNISFNYVEFNNTLFPLLNAFYEQQNLSFRFKTGSSPKSPHPS